MKNMILPFSILLSGLLLLSCNKAWDLSYQPIFEEDYVVAQEILSNDTILLIEQGGPLDELADINSISDVLDFFPYSIYLVHQGQTKDPNILDQAHLRDEDAEIINDISTDILARTIEHFKEEGKHVFVWGASYGCFLGLRTLHRHGNTADKYVLSIGRVALPSEYYEIYQNRKGGTYVSGETIAGTKYLVSKQDWATVVMVGNIGKNDYTKLLHDFNLSNLLFIGREVDERVGRLEDSEISFLENHGAKVVEFPGGHFYGENDLKEILAFFRN